MKNPVWQEKDGTWSWKTPRTRTRYGFRSSEDAWNDLIQYFKNRLEQQTNKIND